MWNYELVWSDIYWCFQMMPDSDQVTESKDIAAGTVKLALIVGIIPRFSEFNGFFWYYTT